MTLHLYTPYHEDALAAGTAGYNPGQAARRQMASRWALPALWATEGDAVLRPDDAESRAGAAQTNADCPMQIAWTPYAN